MAPLLEPVLLSARILPTRNGESWFNRALGMAALAVAASSIYDLPYFLLGPLRPVALEAFGLSNTNAGIVMAVYGLVNLALYMPGGSIADDLPPGALMFVGLVLTGMGGFYMATLPSFLGLCCLLFAWSLSSILVYWAAFVKAMRDWGAPTAQGWSWCMFSALSGLLGVIKLALIVEYFSTLLPDGAEKASLAEKQSAIKAVIMMYSMMTLIAAGMVALGIPLRHGSSAEDVIITPRESSGADTARAWAGVNVLSNLKVWLIASLLLASYFCTSVLNYFPQFAISGYGISAVGAARIGTIGAWVKPIVCLGAGMVADHVRCSVMCAVCLFVFLVLFSLMGSTAPQPGNIGELVTLVVLTNIAGAAISSVFWAILQEARVSLKVTGTVVGFVSVVGYSPDAFSPPLLGYIMDRKPGLEGNQDCMMVGAGFALFGLCASLWLAFTLASAPETDANKSLDSYKSFEASEGMQTDSTSKVD